MCFVKLGFHLYMAYALMFGLTESPAKFQQQNRGVVDLCRRSGIQVYLYLDDRLVVSPPGPPLRKNETTKEVYIVLCLLVAVGGYVSMKKSHFQPKKSCTFLGFDIDTSQGTVSVPQEKILKLRDNIRQFIAKMKDGRYDIGLLQRIRGRCVSWFLVVPWCKMFIREMTLAIEDASWDYQHVHERFNLKLLY